MWEKVFNKNVKASRLSGGGWAESKNGSEAHFWAWDWRCGVSKANSAKANRNQTRCPK